MTDMIDLATYFGILGAALLATSTAAYVAFDHFRTSMRKAG